MMSGGISALVTGVGIPAGAVALTLGAPMVGFGVVRIVDGFRGGYRDISGGFFQVTGEGFGGDGSFGQILDIISGGLPRNIASAFLTGYSIGKLDISGVVKWFSYLYYSPILCLWCYGNCTQRQHIFTIT